MEKTIRVSVDYENSDPTWWEALGEDRPNKPTAELIEPGRPDSVEMSIDEFAEFIEWASQFEGWETGPDGLFVWQSVEDLDGYY